MIKYIKMFYKMFAVKPRLEREYDEMNRFLSQATDRVHLEQLENEWFNRDRSRSIWRHM